jgi:hypothetical protein
MYVRIIAAAALAFAALVLWIYSRHCIALVIPAIVIVIITISTREYAVKRRKCLADYHFRKRSILHRVFSSSTLTTVRSFAISAIAGTTLMLNLLTWNSITLAVLALDIVFVAAVFKVALRACEPVTMVGISPIVAKMCASWINTVVIVAVLFLIQLHSSFPDYLDSSLSVTMERALRTVGSHCDLLDPVVKLHHAKEALGWWLMLGGTMQLNQTSALAAWSLYLLSGSLSIWAYSRYMTQVIHLAIGNRQ